MSALEGCPEFPASTPDESLGLSTNWRAIPSGPSQLAWRPDFPAETRAGPWGPRCNLRGAPYLLPQLKKNREILLSMWDEALSLCEVARESPPSFLSLKRFLDTLDATQEVPPKYPSPLEWNTKFPATTQEKPRFALLILTWGSAGSQHGRSHPWQRSWGWGLTEKTTQNLRDPLDMHEHLPQNLNLPVLLFFNNSNEGLSLTTFLWKKKLT